VALTAEEKGLLGSDYFVNHPPVPMEQIIATINIDMPYFGFPIADVQAFGVEHSTLKAALHNAATQEGLQLNPDSRPELVRFIRSDQYSFVQKGIPGLNLKPGSMSADSALSGEDMLMEYLSLHYHQPSDDLALTFSHEGTEHFVRTALHFGFLVATGRCRPEWNANDFFALKFAASVSNDGFHTGDSGQDGC
jgi:Zn-dependent M28 family amino/carboxypeptidase